ncbi:hypothetical protein QE429_000547 [Bacillus sp. SORGH_AS 510]|uniref:hypothetical protein n=1 Tax=Bacillus sp. SORGH_AS_0510 TaxID=3041771 RepID=UPI00278946C7|nr:hypothetical protein [Bacillus sp. SORGH_AS_0510]MDQ1143720.1 hypothetical protein [Bacillus sp. SORGH_AS_0510]
MKRRKITLIVSAIILLLGLIYYVGFLAPFNLASAINPEGLGVLNIKSFKEIDELEKYFKDYKVEKVKYLGSDTYEVFTNKGEFIIIADYSDRMYWRYKIFKYDQKAKYFTNPM